MIRRRGAYALALFWTSSSSLLFAQTVTESFESGIPATWTIHDNFPLPGVPVPDHSAVPWTVNTLEGMDNYTGGTGLAATASSHNHSGQYDVSLITPPFKITAGDGSTVRYTINFDRVDAFEAFDTNLSVNGGDWIVMEHDTSSLGPAYSTGPPKIVRTISLPFFGAALGDTCRVEFRYYSTFLLPMVRNEYVEIDDVRLPTLVPEPGAAIFAVAAMISGAALSRRARRWDHRT